MLYYRYQLIEVINATRLVNYKRCILTKVRQ